MLFSNFTPIGLFTLKTFLMPDKIRIAHLEAPFVYRTMTEIEANRLQQTDADLPHRHDYYTVIAVENAEGSHQIDFQTYPLSPFTVFFISPEQIHQLQVVGDQPQGQVLLFTVDFLQNYAVSLEHLTEMELFFNCDESKPLQLSELEWPRVQFFLQQIAQEYQSPKNNTLDALGAWLKLFLLECKRLKSAHHLKNAARTTRQAEIVRAFKNEVETHFRAWRQVADFARSQNLTSNYLNEIIKSETGTSAKDFIQNRLLLEAKRLARYSDLSVKEVAYELGYEDVAHFSKFFKKNQGVAFSDFRRGAIHRD
jgi:AraC-like DNA-binding protein